jgi:hypothetical protein
MTMEWIRARAQNVKSATTILSVVIPLVVLAWSSLQYVEINQSQLKQQRFENYHLLIERISGGEKKSTSLSTAIIFELRNYSEYKEVSLRILRKLEKDWKGHPVLSEISLTINHLESLK